jgi:hypothetical protein
MWTYTCRKQPNPQTGGVLGQGNDFLSWEKSVCEYDTAVKVLDGVVLAASQRQDEWWSNAIASAQTKCKHWPSNRQAIDKAIQTPAHQMEIDKGIFLIY